jgi:flagellin
MISVNTNIGAMAAVQNLKQTGVQLQQTQSAISTGKKIANVRDNGAVWVIANKMTTDVQAYSRVRESNDRANAILDTAIAAGEGVMELLNEMKAKALAGTQTGLSTGSQAALAADFAQLRDQITTIVANASFDGTNMVDATPDSAIALGDSSGGNGITIVGANLGLNGGVVTVTGASAVDSAANATTALGQVNASITAVGTQLATWGAGAKRLQVQGAFVSKLQDALNTGIGSLVDADLSAESAKLQSLQVKQQLGIQALSIANSGTQAALSLFR